MARRAQVDVSVTDSPLANFESLTQASVIAVMGAAIVISNILIIASFLNFKGLSNEVINYYLLSLAVADLLCGVFVVPLSVQTRTRSQCWMVFTWISAAMLCLPPLLGYKKEANFDKETFICMLDWALHTLILQRSPF
ncbi:unnamed protein product [Arctia plantaginis]|uniref:G-protein coupled receptors family 1 profile domain-containing protein n=1 Tax=Arctia plantaginis TaxID=874455 RepID=A0A8S1ASM3_ARCPL|nr:unnamed protein product [Arctia plantaginis]